MYIDIKRVNFQRFFGVEQVMYIDINRVNFLRFFGVRILVLQSTGSVRKILWQAYT